MLIAIMIDSELGGGRVASTFREGTELLIYETEGPSLVARHEVGARSDVEIAHLVVEADCEALITGPLEADAFGIIADEGCVTRYHGAGMPPLEALAAMEAYELDLIPDHIGGKGCGSGNPLSCGPGHGEDA